jgi:hypothetical protein
MTVKPAGALSKLTAAIRRIGRNGDRADLDAYMDSEEAAMLKALVPLRNMPAVTAAQDKALKAIEQRHKPLPKGPHRGRWDAAMVERFKASWDRHGGNIYRVSRELGVTEFAVRGAYRRFVKLGDPPTSYPQERVRRAT